MLASFFGFPKIEAQSLEKKVANKKMCSWSAKVMENSSLDNWLHLFPYLKHHHKNGYFFQFSAVDDEEDDGGIRLYNKHSK